jgi:hypothetical protein
MAMSIYDDAFIQTIDNGGEIAPCPDNYTGKDREEWEQGAVDGHISHQHPQVPIKLMRELLNDKLKGE